MKHALDHDVRELVPRVAEKPGRELPHTEKSSSSSHRISQRKNSFYSMEELPCTWWVRGGNSQARAGFGFWPSYSLMWKDGHSGRSKSEKEDGTKHQGEARIPKKAFPCSQRVNQSSQVLAHLLTSHPFIGAPFAQPRSQVRPPVGQSQAGFHSKTEGT